MALRQSRRTPCVHARQAFVRTDVERQSYPERPQVHALRTREESAPGFYSGMSEGQAYPHRLCALLGGAVPGGRSGVAGRRFFFGMSEVFSFGHCQRCPSLTRDHAERPTPSRAADEPRPALAIVRASLIASSLAGF